VKGKKEELEEVGEEEVEESLEVEEFEEV